MTSVTMTKTAMMAAETKKTTGLVRSRNRSWTLWSMRFLSVSARVGFRPSTVLYGKHDHTPNATETADQQAIRRSLLDFFQLLVTPDGAFLCPSAQNLLASGELLPQCGQRLVGGQRTAVLLRSRCGGIVGG